ncbi:MAG: acyltransferase family protein [Lachnospiraceae bacterium]|nr:acyltransferase family protein [Lachnospiraceae bacterium]
MRIAKWDNLKFVLMYLVVFGHMISRIDDSSAALQGLWLFIYTFHIPAFLFVSGLFSKRTVDEHRFERVFSYLFLYFFMEFFRCVVYSLARGKVLRFKLFSETSTPWFALVLFLCYLVTTLFTSLKRSYVLIFAVLAGIFVGYAKDLGSFLAGMRFFIFYPFFYLGYCIPVEKLTEWTERKAVKIISAVCLAAFLAICLVFEEPLSCWQSFLKARNSYYGMDMLRWGGMYRAVYYVLVEFLIFCVIAVIPNIRCVISVWGQRTLQVFALHYPILYTLSKRCDLEDRLMSLMPAHYEWLIAIAAFLLTVVLSLKIWTPFFTWLMRPGRKDEGCKLET